ncbi:MAG: tRNA epoxyqueuosine(34) reductase QueG [bacterium]|nr:tRNA epoxyqueuosine(34) reductase QueG [bacterium]
MNRIIPAERLHQRAVELGFNLVGLTPAAPAPTLDAYLGWIDAEMHGSMGYMARPDRVERRRNLNMILPGVRSLVMVGLDYHALNIPSELLNDPARGRIASYAWGADYHDLMTPRLETLAAWLREEAGGDSVHRVYVDTGAILERSHAQQAGLGFVGKNTMLIHPRRGSFFFLGEILTTLEFDAYDTPVAETMCGRCTRCLTACPTSAFPRPHVLDARRCISYLTIEHKGWVDPTLRPLMGNWVYGCDICQDVCPWQRFTMPTQESAFFPVDVDRAAPRLLDLLALNDSAFQAWFADSAVARIKRERLVRNACVAAGNWRDEAALPPLMTLLDDPSSLIRGHAAWALGQLKTSAARRTLAKRLEHEQNTVVRMEVAGALKEIEA